MQYSFGSRSSRMYDNYHYINDDLSDLHIFGHDFGSAQSYSFV